MEGSRIKMRIRRVVGGLVAVAAASVAWPAAVGAQPTLGELEVSPTTVAPGETVTVTSVTPCEGGETVQWQVDDYYEGPGDVPFTSPQSVHVWSRGEDPVADDGSWELRITAPPDVDDFSVQVSCDVLNYELAEFETMPSTSTTSTTPTSTSPSTTVPTAGPARPVPGRPSFTG